LRYFIVISALFIGLIMSSWFAWLWGEETKPNHIVNDEVLLASIAKLRHVDSPVVKSNILTTNEVSSTNEVSPTVAAPPPPPVVIKAPQPAISKNMLQECIKGLRSVKQPTEKLHVLEFSPAVMSPTMNVNLIKRSWLGITQDILLETISALRHVKTAKEEKFAPRSAVLRELLASHPRVKPTAK